MMKSGVVFVSKQIGDYFFLYWHGRFKAQFCDGAANLFADTKFFKCLQIKYVFMIWLAQNVAALWNSGAKLLIICELRIV